MANFQLPCRRQLLKYNAAPDISFYCLFILPLHYISDAFFFSFFFFFMFHNVLQLINVSAIRVTLQIGVIYGYELL